MKEIEESLFKLQERLSRFKKYRNRDYDDPEYKRIRDIINRFNKIVFNQSINEDYYKPIRTKSAFNVNYIEYKSKEDRSKNLSPEEYLYMIIPYLRDMINDHKAPNNSKIHSRNEVYDYETQ